MLPRYSFSGKIAIFCIVILLIASGWLAQSILLKHQTKSLNLLLISIDTLRPDHMGIYGYKKDTTPNIDAWAKNALVFENVRTTVPMTYPSFASLMTGKHPFDTRISANRGYLISDNNKTLATILKQKGFKTAVFATGAISKPSTNLDQGFEKFEYLPFKNYTNVGDLPTYYQTERKEYEEFLDQTSGWIDQNRNGRFFLWVHLMDPHAPYEPPDNLRCKFNQSLCPIILSTGAEEFEKIRTESQLCQNNPPPKENIELLETLYDGGVAYSDQLVGKILEKLKQTGLDKNTLVVLYGDHGEGFDHNYYFNHRAVLYDSAVKIPLVIKHPYLMSGRSNILLQNTDIFSSVLQLLGVRTTSSADNADFSQEFSIFKSAPLGKKSREYVYLTNNTFTKFAISDGRYKYIYSLAGSCLLNNKTDELYDLEADPQELKNIYSEDHPTAKKLKDILFKHLSKYNLPPYQAPPSNPSDQADETKELNALPY